MNQYGDYYATLTEGELLKLANHEASLVEEAQQALAAELARRGLGPVQVGEFAVETNEPLEPTKFAGLNDDDLLHVAKEPETLPEDLRAELIVEFLSRELDLPPQLAALASDSIPFRRAIPPTRLSRRRPFGIKVLAIVQIFGVGAAGKFAEEAPIVAFLLGAFLLTLAYALWTLRPWARTAARFCYGLNAVLMIVTLALCLVHPSWWDPDCDAGVYVGDMMAVFISGLIAVYLGKEKVRKAFRKANPSADWRRPATRDFPG